MISQANKSSFVTLKEIVEFSVQFLNKMTVSLRLCCKYFFSLGEEVEEVKWSLSSLFKGLN